MMAGTRLGRRLLGAVGLMALQACVVVGRDYEPPEPNVPDMWHEQLAEGLTEGDASLHTWWELLDDPVLDDLIARVAPANFDLALAFARMQEARARRGIATSARYPDVNANGSATRSRRSEGVIPDGTPIDRHGWFYDSSVDATWEVDFWGRISRLIEAEDASMQASVEAYRDLLVVLYADVAISYVEVRALQDRLRYAHANVGTQTGTLKLTKDRFDTGLAPLLDVAQAELNLANTRTLIPSLELQLGQVMNRLAVLVGEAPGAVHELLADEQATIPAPPAQVAMGLPADLLRQRPDVRAAERDLAAQTALEGVAEAALYPTFSLFGSFGYQADADPFDGENRT
jgi:outer membrane protein, multidrug efflux system